jgi:hypothetical protein
MRGTLTDLPLLILSDLEPGNLEGTILAERKVNCLGQCNAPHVL